MSKNRDEAIENRAERRLLDVKSKIRLIRYAAFAALAVVLSVYFFRFHNGLSTDVSDFGAAGDFVGGFLNPIFAMGALFALLYTIVLQVEEMQDMRTEFAKTVDASRQQTFESTLFQLVRLHHDLVLNLQYTKIDFGAEPVPDAAGSLHFKVDKWKGREAISHLSLDWFVHLQKVSQPSAVDLDDVEREAIADDLFTNEVLHVTTCFSRFLNEHYSAIGHYLRNIYQLFRFIDDAEYLSDKERRSYSRLVRSHLTPDELDLVFYNCLLQKHSAFAALVNKYALFEHIDIAQIYSVVIHTISPLHLFFFDMQAYGDRPPPLPDGLTLPRHVLDHYEDYIAEHPPVETDSQTDDDF